MDDDVPPTTPREHTIETADDSSSQKGDGVSALSKQSFSNSDTDEQGADLYEYTADNVVDTAVNPPSKDGESWFAHEPQINMNAENNDGSPIIASSKPSSPIDGGGVDSTTDPTSSLKDSTLLVSDWMSDNMLVVRYGLIASIGLLAAYGISQSPLMFRYRKISEIPAAHFLDRRTLHCRLVKVDTTSSNRTTLYCRHLSLAERLLSLRWNGVASSPSSKDTKDCLPVQLVGIEAPEKEPNTSTKQIPSDDSLLQYISTDKLQPVEDRSLDFLDDLADKAIPISCQLMARGVTESSNPKKRPIPGFAVETLDEPQMAFGTIWYRPKGPFQIFASDLGLKLVERGEAVVSTDLYGLHPGMKIVDADGRKHLRKDAMYVSKTLADGERVACQKAYGVWKNELYRRERQDFVDEVEFWEKASWPRRLWRWIRGG